MAHKSQDDETEKNGSFPSILYCKNDLKEGSLQWVKDPLNGQVLMVLSMDNNCSATSFDMEFCAEKLKSLGVQVATDQWRRLIQDAVLKPEVRRYLFYNSRAFQIVIAVINTNTDVRLAAVNEIFIQHSLILGITDVLDGPHNILQLWFVHFSPERCLQSLSAHITALQGTRESGLWHSLGHLGVVMEVVVLPDPGTETEQKQGMEEDQASCEESPLLSSAVKLKKEPVTCNELLHLVPEGPPEVMAQQLLVIFSGCYIRLLVTGQLPRAVAGGHLEHTSVPCLCQFIKTTMLNMHQSWFTGR
ncbi:transmembrane protein 268 isoform X3 [Apus apus]|uniref:transmembrane protein 268 isoform X3 n=1 Tax=Apus apus TaxID=8895 RepID=UPI0021F8F7E5|nr:transmembrane protein 268 isoform X3 [Apus apus]